MFFASCKKGPVLPSISILRNQGCVIENSQVYYGGEITVGPNGASTNNSQGVTVTFENGGTIKAVKADNSGTVQSYHRLWRDYFINGNGDKQDLIFRLELYFYAFKLFCRKEVKIDRNQFTIFLNDSILEWNLIKLVMDDFTDFEFEIEAVKENNDVLINLNYTLHF